MAKKKHKEKCKNTKECQVSNNKKIHEEICNELLEEYKKYQIDALKFRSDKRGCFFWFCIILIAIPSLFLFRTMYEICCDDYIINTSEERLLGIVLFQLTAFVSAIIVLPQIIAKYCFYKKEDKFVLQLPSRVLKDDRKK